MKTEKANIKNKFDSDFQVEILENKETIPPHIIACVTMWHESKPEMLEMLKSLLRLDIDQCFKKMAMHNNYDPEAISNYYTFEGWIRFFKIIVYPT